MLRLYHAFRNSFAGLRHALGHETSFRQEVILFFAALPFAWFLSTGLAMFAAMMGAIVLIMIVELLNTAVEAVCNGLSRDYMVEIKIAKDCGSAAVLLSSSLAAAVWLTAIYYRFF